MNKKTCKVLAAILCVLMLVSMLPMAAFAANDYTINSTTSTDNYYNLISKKDWNIAPGITESEIVLNNDGGSRRQVLFVFLHLLVKLCYETWLLQRWYLLMEDLRGGKFYKTNAIIWQFFFLISYYCFSAKILWLNYLNSLLHLYLNCNFTILAIVLL